MKQILLILITCLLTVSGSTGLADVKSGEKSVYTLSVVPRSPALRLQQIWQPIVSHLSKITHKEIRLQIPVSFKQFELDLTKGKPDLVFLNPYHMCIANTRQGYTPLVRSGSKLLVGLLVTRKGGPYKTLRDLNRLELAFPSPNAFGASLYMRALLAEKEKIRFTPVYVKSHANVYRNVALGLTAAGGGVNSTFNKEHASLKKELQVIYETPGVANHPLAAHPRVPASVRNAIASAVINLYKTEAGKDMLKKASLDEPITADFTRDYKPLLKLELEKYFVERTE